MTKKRVEQETPVVILRIMKLQTTPVNRCSIWNSIQTRIKLVKSTKSKSLIKVHIELSISSKVDLKPSKELVAADEEYESGSKKSRVQIRNNKQKAQKY